MLTPAEILYEDHACLVVLKPPGLLTQAPPGIDSLERRVKAFLRQRDGGPAEPYLGLPHRLDRPASGALILARTRRAARNLSRQFESRSVEKTYWACVEGIVDPPQGTWEDFLRKVPGQPLAIVTGAGDPLARQASLSYRTLGHSPLGSWLEIRLQTGRTHQIRVQAASRGAPLIGDAQYGAATPFGEQHDDARQRAIALHARRLVFRRPGAEERIRVVAPPPLPWRALLDPDQLAEHSE
jgi:RluA family pseudouridine synthase